MRIPSSLWLGAFALALGLAGGACSAPADEAEVANGGTSGGGAGNAGGAGGSVMPGAGNAGVGTGGTGGAGGSVGGASATGGTPPTTGGSAGAPTTGGGAGVPATGGSGAGQAGAPPIPPGGGFIIDGTCIAACAAATTDADGDGCGFDTRDCVLTSAPIAMGATACEYNGAAPTPGEGFLMGCRCVRPCTGADTSDPTDDGWGWEFGATCVVSGGPAVTGKLACVPPAMATGDGYLIKTTVEGTGEEIEKCVPACERPDWVDDPDGWGYEHRETCIVAGSVAEMQVSRCTLTPHEFPWEPGPGYMLKDGTTMQETCYPPCANPDDTDPTDDGWGYEQERACIVPDSKPALQGAPCIPAAATVEGTCPADVMCPVVDGQTVTCGCTWVDGFKERKAEILAVVDAAGTQSWGTARYFLASAMMETSNMLADYPLGDVYPGGQPKTGDAFNAGITKQNWGMMRQCHAAWNGSSDYMLSAAMNSNLTLDVQVYNECRSMFGTNWWSGHRNGANSLGTNTFDIRVFKAAMDWTWSSLQEGGGHFEDDVYFWADVTAI